MRPSRFWQVFQAHREATIRARKVSRAIQAVLLDISYKALLADPPESHEDGTDPTFAPLPVVPAWVPVTLTHAPSDLVSRLGYQQVCRILTWTSQVFADFPAADVHWVSLYQLYIDCAGTFRVEGPVLPYVLKSVLYVGPNALYNHYPHKL